MVLPSYREGTPRTLLEAAAMARAITTTDAPDFLCQPRDAADLAAKMGQLLAIPAAQRCAMGLRGRQKMEREFDE